nr:MAG TPA: hypothetical protein [Caudoviricetes sp.]
MVKEKYNYTSSDLKNFKIYNNEILIWEISTTEDVASEICESLNQYELELEISNHVGENLNKQNVDLHSFIAIMALKYKEIEDFAIKNNIIGYPVDTNGR